MASIVKKILRIHDLKNMYGETPTDEIVNMFQGVVLASGDAVVQTTFAPGTVVKYTLWKQATVDDSGQITVQNDAIGDTATVTAFVQAQGMDLQTT